VLAGAAAAGTTTGTATGTTAPGTEAVIVITIPAPYHDDFKALSWRFQIIMTISTLYQLMALSIRMYTHTLQHTATLCNTLQHTATHCNTLQRTATPSFFHPLLERVDSQHSAYIYTHTHTATHSNAMQFSKDFIKTGLRTSQD